MQLVERRRSALDRRVVLVATTEQGRALRDQLLPPVQQSYFELRDSIDDDTWRALIDGLDAIVNSERRERQ